MRIERLRIIEGIRLRLRKRRLQLIRCLVPRSGSEEAGIRHFRLPALDWMLFGLMAVELDRVECALRFIREDRYGVCRECSGPIVSERLEVNPLTQRCQECHVRHTVASRRDIAQRRYK
jgi:hypothetical protein